MAWLTWRRRSWSWLSSKVTRADTIPVSKHCSLTGAKERWNYRINNQSILCQAPLIWKKNSVYPVQPIRKTIPQATWGKGVGLVYGSFLEFNLSVTAQPIFLTTRLHQQNMHYICIHLFLPSLASSDTSLAVWVVSVLFLLKIWARTGRIPLSTTCSDMPFSRTGKTHYTKLGVSNM